jgi:hypothetical protein
MEKKKMNMNELAKLLCHYEKGKEEVSIAQMKEILKNLCVLMCDDPQVIALLINHGGKCEKV